MPAAINVFISYAPQDAPHLADLSKHLALLQRQGHIAVWSAHDLQPGDRRAEIAERLESADVVLFLVSASFLEPDELWHGQLQKALARRARDGTRVVPIILRPVDWEASALGELHALPANGRPITSWDDADAAWTDVAKGLRRLLINEPSYLDEESRKLSQALDEAFAQEKDLLSVGSDPAPARQKILDLRRRLREGGQLKPGDYLLANRFRLLESLGSGGFAKVWKAFDSEERELVAIKVLHGQYAEDKTRRERFFRGARVMARLQHQGIVRVIEDKIVEEGYYFYVMEHVGGGNLRHAILEGRLAGEEGLRVVCQAGDALHFAHQQGLIHRDIKPANILLGDQGEPKLTDFDLVRNLHSTGGTRSGTPLGTYPYMAPEAIGNAGDADVRSDVYSLAMMAAFVLHGAELPPAAQMDPESFLADLACTQDIREGLVRGASYERESRFDSVSDLVWILREGLSSTPDPERTILPDISAPSSEGRDKKRLWLPVLIVVLSAALWGLWAYTKAQRDPIQEVIGSGPEPPEDSREVGAASDRQPLDPQAFPVMVTIDGGSFQMGSTKHTTTRPINDVYVAPFQISKTEVTVAQYDACFKAGGCDHLGREACNSSQSDRENHPVNCATWHQAQVYLDWLNRQQELAGGYRLPSEAEWEYAARGRGRTVSYPWGDEPADCERAAVWTPAKGNGCGRGGTWPVCSFPNGNTPEELCDMAGNVWEWVEDVWSDYPQVPSTSGVIWLRSSKAIEVADARTRIFRGGSWKDHWDLAQVTNRGGQMPGAPQAYIGFRVARSFVRAGGGAAR